MASEEIYKNYIDTIPKFNDSSHFTSHELYEIFKQNLSFADIEPINLIRFQRKFKEYAKNGETYYFMKEKFKEISNLSQKLFDVVFPYNLN